MTVCSPWTTANEVQTCAPCADVLDATLADMIDVASDVLFALSGYRFPGECEDTVRPCGGRPGNDGPIRQVEGDIVPTRSTATGIQVGCGCSSPRACGCGGVSEITLGGWPVIEVTQVKLDGVVLDLARYRVDDYRYLVRLPDADGSHQSWPCCQEIDLPSTEDNTFEVSFTYGQAPPASGVLAAKVLACELALACTGGDGCRLPKRVTSIVRQGIAMTVIDPFEFLTDGLTGLYEVDLFLGTHGAARTKRMPAAVVNPDIHRAIRRTGV